MLDTIREVGKLRKTDNDSGSKVREWFGFTAVEGMLGGDKFDGKSAKKTDKYGKEETDVDDPRVFAM